MVIEHLESNLGKITKGIKLSDSVHNISIGLFKNQPFFGINTLATIGLSNYKLSVLNKTFNMELILGIEDYHDESLVSKFLLSFSEYLINKEVAPYKGDVFDFNEKIIPNSEMCSVYITNPIFYKSGFQSLSTVEKNIIFPWVFPIYKSESLFIKKNGWENFEIFLEENRINTFWDLHRDQLFND